jgi:type IV pilus assembly protein PilY1
LLLWAPAGQTLTLADAPLYLSSSVKPNVLVIYDNSQSMEWTMPNNQLTTYTDPDSRGNIAREVLRDVITRYRSSFRWGLESFEALGTPFLHDYRPYYDMTLYYADDLTGNGWLVEPVQDDSTAHYNTLMTQLAAETAVAGTSELKNFGYATPLAGSLRTARQYFANELSTGTPITDRSCQRQFVVLATDGIPNLSLTNFRYTAAADLNNTQQPDGSWQFGTAANEVFGQVTALRTTTITNNATYNGSYDVQTYVVGMGTMVNDAGAVAAMNQMAFLGGTTQAYLADNRNALVDAFSRISSDIVARTSAAAAVSMNSGSWSSGARVYQGRFNSGDWSGQLLAHDLLSSGALSSTATWDAAQRLNAQNWDTGRQIVTYKASAALGSRGVAFRWPVNAAAPGATEIDPALVTALNTSRTGTVDGLGSQRLEWLRGNTARELRNCASCAAPVFRNRAASVLGDIVNSSPVYVSGGGRYLRDSSASAAYSSYKATRRAGTALVMVGANDGMLHAFNAATGDEVFAYVPAAVASRLSGLSDTGYTHRYTVDGPLAAGDVFYDSAWHTLVVGAMGAGAKGLYALDVSNPAQLDESHAASIARWETAGTDADIGHIFHAPVLAKMKNGRWMAISGNGVNSTNGRAVLLLVDVETGAVTKIDTLAGSSGTPNGLSGVVALSSANNGVADIVYAGDLAGNLWRFDLSSATVANWKVAYGTTAAPAPLFTTASGQPITSQPDVTPHASGGYMLVFGTGRYIDTGDNTTTTQQALYGIWDNGAVVSSTQLVTQSVLGTSTGSDGRSYRIVTFAVGTPANTSYTGDNSITAANYLSTKRGWKLDLPTSGERIVSQASVRWGKAIATSLIPQATGCGGGGDGWLLEVDAFTGNRPDTAALDTNADNAVTSGDLLSYSGGSAHAAGVRIGAIPSTPGFIRSQTRSLDDKLINTSSGSVLRVREAGNSATSGRVSWEQLK